MNFATSPSYVLLRQLITMQCYKQVLAPTAVNASVSLPFLSSTANNLVVAKSSVLQIFALKSVVSDSRDDSAAKSQHVPNGKPQRRDRAHLTKLVLISEHEIAGTVTSLARISAARSKTGGDLLLVALKDAKLSLVEWDPEKYTISTVSIHFYERDDLQGAPWSPSFDQSQTCLTVDPSSRCAAFKFAARQMAILPLSRGVDDDLAMDDYDADVENSSRRRKSSSRINGDVQTPSAHPASFVLSLLSLDPALTHPRRLAFLYEYREPTVGILSSQVAPSSAMLPSRKDCMTYTVYTLDLEQRASTTLLSVQNLPYDIHELVPLPLPIGGALLVGPNELIHVDQAGKTNGIAVNEFAKRSSAFPMVSQEELNLKLDDCRVESLGSTSGELLIFLGTGELAILRFRVEGRSVSALYLEKVPAANGGNLLNGPVSCSSPVGRGRLFIGSEQSDSVVLGWSSRTQSIKRQQSEANGDTLGDDLQLDSDFDSLDDDDLYGNSKADKSRGKGISAASLATTAEDCDFKVHDRLPNLSPLAHLAILPPSDEGELAELTGLEAQKCHRHLAAVAGKDECSKLVRLSPTLPLRVAKRYNLAALSRIWFLHVENLNTDSIPGRGTEFDNVVVTATAEGSESGSSQVHILKGDELQQLGTGDFESDAGTSLEVFTLLGGLRVIQVLPTELRAFDGGEWPISLRSLCSAAPSSSNLPVSGRYAGCIQRVARVAVKECFVHQVFGSGITTFWAQALYIILIQLSVPKRLFTA